MTLGTEGAEAQSRNKRRLTGPPDLSRADIERRAYRALERFSPETLTSPERTPLLHILDRLRQEFDIPARVGVELGVNRRGAKILGSFNLLTWEVAVDRELVSGDPRFGFTLAHELGHLSVHRHVDPSCLESGPILDDSPVELALPRAVEGDVRSGFEWQANAFAAALLMPAATFPRVLVGLQKQMGMTRRLGRVYFDNKGAGRHDQKRLLFRIAQFYGTSQAAVRIRLSELGLAEEQPGSAPLRSIGEILFRGPGGSR